MMHTIYIDPKRVKSRDENGLLLKVHHVVIKNGGEYIPLFKFKDVSKINDIEVIHGDIRKGDIKHSLASIDSAKNALNYKPEINVSEGLQKSIQWYWNNLR